jgi:Domain of unknown function (DUF3846)
MMGRALVYRVNAVKPEEHLLIAPPALKFLQEVVGGYIETVPYFDTIEIDGVTHNCVAYCNEEGKLHALKMNGWATVLWDRALRRLHNAKGDVLYPKGLLVDPDGGLSDILVGSIVVLVGDAEFMEEM